MIHIREKNIAGPFCEIKKALAFIKSQKGPAFFDEDYAWRRFMKLPLQPV